MNQQRRAAVNNSHSLDQYASSLLFFLFLEGGIQIRVHLDPLRPGALILNLRSCMVPCDVTRASSSWQPVSAEGRQMVFFIKESKLIEE